MELVLNELSCNRAFPDIRAAREGMSELLFVCKKAIQMGAERSLRTKESLLQQTIAPGYLVVQWLNDPEVDKENQRFLKSLAHKFPFIDGIVEADLYDRELRSEFTFNGNAVKGLGAAFLLDGLAVSFNTEVCWDTPDIPILMEYIDEDGLNRDEIRIKHASRTLHIDSHSEWFDLQKLKKIYDGRELWRNREALFPSLIFCDHIEEQISDFHLGQPLFRQIVKRLFELNLYFSNWSEGLFEPEQIPCKITPESNETLIRFEKEHSFTCPDGTKQIFSWHARLTPGAWRMFFIPDENIRKGIVGYIGSKLPTVDYPK